MAKHIDADLLRKEIERLKETHERNLDKPMERGRIGYAHGCVDCCDRILSFINSLQQEKHEVDLEKEIVRFLSNSTKMNKGEWRGKYAISDIGFRAVAHHFYELGLNTRCEE